MCQTAPSLRNTYLTVSLDDNMTDDEFKLPDIRNRVKIDYIDASPDNYPVRILEHYLLKASEEWIVDDDCDCAILYRAMNEHQKQRREVLSEAIRILKQYYE